MEGKKQTAYFVGRENEWAVALVEKSPLSPEVCSACTKTHLPERERVENKGGSHG